MADGVVEFPDGRRVRGRGLHRPLGEAVEPEFGVYLLDRQPDIGAWAYHWIRWPDFGLPASTADALAALREAHLRAESERVEIACDGGNGRTGTALSVLAIMSGVAADNAVGWVREHYRRTAVETFRQRRWISEVSTSVRN